jgi:hypothetical protein
MASFISANPNSSFDKVRLRKAWQIASNRVDVWLSREIFVKWEQTPFPKTLYNLITNHESLPPFLKVYFERDMTTMQLPRLYELSEMLGVNGIGQVIRGNR